MKLLIFVHCRIRSSQWVEDYHSQNSRGSKVKTIVYLLSVLLVLSLGCKGSINSSNPVQNGNNNNYNTNNANKELIPIPPDSSGTSDSLYSVTKTVVGSKGGNLVLNFNYHGLTGNHINIHAELKIPKGAFADTTDITITVDNEYAAVYFNPHMSFNIPLRLNLTFTGLDLNALNIDPSSFDFGFIDDNGNFEHIPSQTCNLNINAGLISVTGAQLNHFSRYGFVR